MGLKVTDESKGEWFDVGFYVPMAEHGLWRRVAHMSGPRGGQLCFEHPLGNRYVDGVSMESDETRAKLLYDACEDVVMDLLSDIGKRSEG